MFEAQECHLYNASCLLRCYCIAIINDLHISWSRQIFKVIAAPKLLQTLSVGEFIHSLIAWEVATLAYMFFIRQSKARGTGFFGDS